MPMSIKYTLYGENCTGEVQAEVSECMGIEIQLTGKDWDESLEWAGFLAIRYEDDKVFIRTTTADGKDIKVHVATVDHDGPKKIKPCVVCDTVGCCDSNEQHTYDETCLCTKNG